MTARRLRRTDPEYTIAPGVGNLCVSSSVGMSSCSSAHRSRTRRRPRPRIAILAGPMSQTEGPLRRFSQIGVRKRWEKIRGIEDEDDDEYENDTTRMSGSSSLPDPAHQPCSFSAALPNSIFAFTSFQFPSPSSRHSVVCREPFRVLDYDCPLIIDDYQESICSEGFHHGHRLCRDGRTRLAI